MCARVAWLSMAPTQFCQHAWLSSYLKLSKENIQVGHIAEADPLNGTLHQILWCAAICCMESSSETGQSLDD